MFYNVGFVKYLQIHNGNDELGMTMPTGYTQILKLLTARLLCNSNIHVKCLSLGFDEQSAQGNLLTHRSNADLYTISGESQ